MCLRVCVGVGGYVGVCRCVSACECVGVGGCRTDSCVMNACSGYCAALCSRIPVNVCKLSWNVKWEAAN